MKKFSRYSKRLILKFALFVAVQCVFSIILLKNSPNKLYFPFYSWSHYTYEVPGDPCSIVKAEIQITSIDGISVQAAPLSDFLKQKMRNHEYFLNEWLTRFNAGRPGPAENSLSRYKNQVFSNLKSVEFVLGYKTIDLINKVETFTAVKEDRWSANDR